MAINYEEIARAQFDTVPTKFSEGQIFDMWAEVNRAQGELFSLFEPGRINVVPDSTRLIVRAKADPLWNDMDFGFYDDGQANLNPFNNPMDIDRLDQIFASLVEVGNPGTKTYNHSGVVLAVQPGDIGKIYPIDVGGKLHFPPYGTKPVGLCAPDELIAATKGYNEIHLWGRKVNPQSEVRVIGYFMLKDMLPAYEEEVIKCAQANNLPIVSI